jgi:P27 family predicted phage terminase small subunit
MKAPKGLGNRGRALWRSIIRQLPKDWVLDEREAVILTMAARQADDLQRLETVIAKDGAMVTGSQGQPVVNPAIVESRQARLAINRLLGELSLPDDEDDEEPKTAAGRRAQRAANARWDQHARRRGMRRGV